MQATEHPHNTPEQVQAYLQGALAIVANIPIDDDLRAIAFEKAVNLLAAKQIFYEQPQLLPPTMAIPRNTRH